jgi:hypothetical protein
MNLVSREELFLGHGLCGLDRQELDVLVLVHPHLQHPFLEPAGLG